MLRSVWSPLSPVIRGALALAALGVVADVVHHMFSPDIRIGRVFPIEFVGHVLTLAGMLFALMGVVNAARLSRRRGSKEGGTYAARSGAAATR